MPKQAPIERARDELFSHIHRCGVLEASAADQDVWMTETVEYLGERYPELATGELDQLKTVGMQFCKPVISRLQRRNPAPDPEANGATVPPATLEADEALLGAPRSA